MTSSPHLDDAHRRGRYRFADFELDAETGELTRRGEAVPLPPQAARLLALLVERPGSLVTREEIRRCLWPPDTHVEAELGINYAVRRIRRALDDESANPTFVETLPRRGYRFRSPVETMDGADPGGAEGSAGGTSIGAAARGHPAVSILIAAVLVVGLGALVAGALRREPTAAPAPPRLAVFPLAASDELRPVAQGLGEEITASLIRYLGDGVDVVAFSSTRQLGVSPATEEVAARLSADFQLTGTLTADGQLLRAHLSLAGVGDGRELWTGTFAVARHDLAAARGDLARGVATALGRELPLAGPEPPAVRVPPEAWERYLLGLGLLQTLPDNELATREERTEQIRRAISLFEECVAAAPDFADGWAALARARDWSQLWAPPGEWGPAEEAAAARAVALDPGQGEALATLGQLALDIRRDWADADRLTARAVRHGRGMSRTHAARSDVLAAAGRIAEARRELAEARRLDPLDWLSAYQEAYLEFLGRDFAEAKRRLTLLRRGHPADPFLVSLLVRIHVLEGDEEAALAVVRDLWRRSMPGEDPPTALAAYWQRMDRYFRRESQQRYVAVHWRALPLIGLGRLTEAAELLRDEACGDHPSILSLIHVDPFYLQLEGQPAYEEAVRCVGMPRVSGDDPRARP